ncbi:protein TASOR 2 isoform X2 [Carettochelys insculpta]|uniref:protein TASOR 2 isoform X2 n=1 Tax=Carettochelys insculpta TaxID=44489 RepID=UPI003EB9FE15
MGERRGAAAGPAFHQVPADSSSLYQAAVSVLHNSYLDSTSRDGFRYDQVTLVNNDVFLNEYKAFIQEKEASGYTKEELEEAYAFLLFDNEREAKAVCQSGLRVNTRSLTTLGDPAKGAYVSKYSDYLQPRPWYSGKSGCIVIFKLIKGKVKLVPENYTANYTCPTPGYDCHVSANINNVSLETSHFRAFELTQYYVYEFSGDSMVERPRQICPYVIITFQYAESKRMPTLHYKSIIERESKAFHCLWRGQLSIQGHLLCEIALKSPYSGVIPAQLPAKLEMKYVMGVSDLKKKLPEAAFGKNNYTRNEVRYQDIYFSLYEVELLNKDQHKMDSLLENLKEKDLAIIKYLQDQGFLILLASSALTGDKGDLGEPIKLQALFLFTSSRSVCLTDSGLPDIAAEIRVETEKTKNAPEVSQLRDDVKVDRNPAGNLKMQQNKRRCSKAIVTSTKKKWAPLKILSVVDNNRKGTKTKKMNVSFPFPKKQGLTTNSNEPTLKLANLQFPHERKRGAEVLSAEFIHRTQSEPTTKGTSSPEDTPLETKKLKKLKKIDAKKEHASDKVTEQTKSEAIEAVTKEACNPKAREQLEPVRREILSQPPNAIPPERQEAASGANETYTESVTAQDVSLTLTESNCESHALNLLADLALSSCLPPLAHNDARVASPADSSKERRSLRKRKPSRFASDHEYHRVDKQLKGEPSSSKTPNQKLASPEKSDAAKDLAALPGEKSPVNSSKKSCPSPNSAKTREGLEPSDVNKHCSIASEHSYASQMSEQSKKHTFPKGGQGPATFRNGAKSASSGPLVGKVLPFRHQQHSAPMQKPSDDLAVKRRRGAPSPRLKEDFSKSHSVKSCKGSVTVTCRWEADYLFDLDSKYTNNSLEKTVIRALHGPWDPDIPDDVEEMKLILHMWVALFYSKPNKFLSSTRKVVEHSNPEKYVSINSSLDAFELSDDCEGSFDLEKCPADSQSEASQVSSNAPDPMESSDDCRGSFGLEKCAADSQSEANQISSTIHSPVSSSSDKPLSCDEPSSTTCPKTCPNDDCGDANSVPAKAGLQEVIVDGCEDVVCKVDEEGNKEEELLDPVISISSSTCNPADKPCGTRLGSEELSTEVSEEPSAALDLSNVSQSGSAFSQTEFPKEQENGQPAVIDEDAVLSEEKEALDNITLSVEDKDNCHGNGNESLHLCGAIPLDEAPQSTKHGSQCGEVSDPYDPLEDQGEEEEEEEEEDLDYESIHVEPIDLALSESNDADLEHEDVDEAPISLVLPEEIGKPEESKATSPCDSEEPFDSVLTLKLSPGASPVGEVPSDEITPSAGALPENQEVAVKPAEETHDADLEQEVVEQDQMSSAFPKETCVPEESKARSLLGLESPSDSVLTLRLSPGASPVHEVPSDEITQTRDALPDSQEVTVQPTEEIHDANLEQEDMDQDQISLVFPKEPCVPEESKASSLVGLESPSDSLLTVTSPAASPLSEVPSDEVTPSANALPENPEVAVKPDQETHDADLEQEVVEQDQMSSAFPKETCVPEESKASSLLGLESPSDSVLTLKLSPSASPAPKVPSDEITRTPDALPDSQEVAVQPTEEIKSPAQGDSLEDSCISQEDRGTGSAVYISLSIKESNQAQSNTATQGEHRSSSADTTELLNKASGASESPSLVLEDINLEADCVAEESCDKFKNTSVCSVSKQSPGNEELNQVTMVVTHGEDETSLCNLIKSACTLSADNENSLAEEHLTLKQINCVNRPCMHGPVLSEEETSPGDKLTRTDPDLVIATPVRRCSSLISRETDLHKSILQPSEHDDPVLCRSTNSNHTDPLDVMKICSISESQIALSTGDGASRSHYAEQPKTDTFLDHEIPAVNTADLLEIEEEMSPADEPTCSTPELLTGAAHPPRHSPISKETDVHNSSLKQSEKDPFFSGSMDSEHMDRTNALEMAPAAVEGFSGSCDTEQAIKDPFLQREVPVGKVADLQKMDDQDDAQKEPTLCEAFDLGSTSPAASNPEEQVEPFMHVCSQSSVCEITDLQKDCMTEDSDMLADLHQTNSYGTREEIPVSSVPVPPTSCGHADSRETLDLSDTDCILEELLASPGTECLAKDRGAHLTLENVSYKSFSGDSDQEYFEGSTHPTAKFRGSRSRRAIDATHANTVTKTNYDCSCLSSVYADFQNDDWGPLEADNRFSGAESGWPLDRYVPPFVNIRDDQGTTRDYRNFTVTKKHKEKTRTLQSAKRRDCSTERSDLISSLTRNWKVIDDLTQNTLDMECLRFSYKLKQILKSQKSQLSTSNISIFPREFSPQLMAETLPRRETPEASGLYVPPRSRSPLLITVVPSGTRQRSSLWHSRNTSHADFAKPPLYVPWQDTFSNERRAAKIKSQGRNFAHPLHLSKLKYDDKLKESRGDISVILSEYAEFNRVMLNSIHAGSQGRSQSPTSGESTGRRSKGCPYFPKRPASYETMISDLCSTLCYRLQSVAKEACSNSFLFYLVETEDDPFFARMKSLLKTAGHTETEPLNFCKTRHPETDRLLVIIRNEDISLHIHKIPSLLRLKHCPNVTFAGVDSLEDITDHTYQELFHMGGFVVSDDEVLETVTLGQLKEIIKTLEKLNSHGRWKWLLHYKESKKLKEDIRVGSTTYKKNLLLKSSLEASIIQVLHYHQCDSKGGPKAGPLKCLLNLQVQHVQARFAVYLTDQPSASREALESKGILVTDADNFTGTVQKMVAPFHGSCW